MATRTLVQKLGLKPGMVACVLNPPPNYDALVEEAQVTIHPEPVPDADFVHVFAESRDMLWGLLELGRRCVRPTGMLWISWPKKASGVVSDLSFRIVHERGKALGMVDVKVCAVDAVWSGLKFVYRLRDRGKIPRATGTGSQPSTT